MKKIGLLVLLGISLIGAYGVISALFQGHTTMNSTQHVPWGLWVALYIYFLGLSAGSFLLSTLIYVFGIKRLEAVGPMALLQALLCLGLGGFLIIMDLGHPLRVYKVLFSMNPTSVMAWMGLFYNFYILIVAAELYLVLKGEQVPNAGKWLRNLGIIGIPVAIIVHGGVGLIFAVAKARPNWFSGLFPIIFLISALASGGALLTFLTAFFSKQPVERKLPLVRDIAMLTVGILCFDLLLLFSEILVTFYGGVSHETIGWKLTLFGPYWWVFWFVQLGLGSAIPIFIVLSPKLNRSIPWLGTSGFLVAFGIIGTRLNIVIPPQIQPVFETLPEAYHHFRNSIGYFPSLTEWLVATFTFALGTWIFLLAKKLLPLERAQGGEAQ